MSNLPEIPIEPPKKGLFASVSLIWLIPMAAISVAVAVAYQNYSERGRVINVTFNTGAGLVANSTELRHRDVAVGIVEDISLTKGLEAVNVAIRVTPDISPYIDTTAQFWVVRPELTTQGVTGLETVLSGVYIEGSWDREAGDIRNDFRGRPEAPLFRADRPGLQISLRSSPRGQLVDDSPILYRGIEVGRIGKASIDPRGGFAVAEAIIYEPHDRLINSTTRFWDTSGFSVSVGASGASIDFTSVASLLAGGITFETFVSGGRDITDGAQFQVYSEEGPARDSIFNQSAVEELIVSVVFDDNISGLNVDAAVELAGLRIGSVRSVFGVVDEELYGDNRVRLNAVLAIQPGRLGLEGDVSPEAAETYLRDQARSGLRAQLASASMLAGGLKVQFVPIENATGSLRETDDGVLVLPTARSEITSGQASVEGVITRINALPVEDLMNSAIDFLNSARSFVASDGLREMPEDLRRLLASVTGVVESGDVQGVAANLNAVLVQTETLLKQLETEQTISRALAAVEAVTNAAGTVGSSVTGVPDLIAELTEVARTARDVPLDTLTQRLTGIVETADNLMQTDGVQELPDQLNGALSELNATLQELRQGGAVGNVNATLASARDAADAVAVSTRDLPALAQRLSRVLDQASTTIRGYDEGEALSRQAQAALRDIQAAADAITALARTLERNPSSLIRGR